MNLKIGIVEDNRNLTKTLLDGLAGYTVIKVVFTAINGADAIHKLQKLDDSSIPDIILMDIEMPEMNGIEATEKIKAKYGKIKISMLTVFDQDEKIFDAILAGASGYMLKDEPVSKIVSGMQDIMEGGAAMSPIVAAKAMALLAGKKPENAIETEEKVLSKRETEILELVSKGLTYSQIAEKCFISPGTVRKHIDNIYEKLHVHSKIDAVRVATKKNWIGFNIFF